MAEVFVEVWGAVGVAVCVGVEVCVAVGVSVKKELVAVDVAVGV